MKRKYYFWVLPLLFSLISCSKDDDKPTDKVEKGSVLGSVNLYDEGVTKLSDHSGMKVYIDGKSNEFSALTDQQGSFSIKDVPYGTYTFVYEKVGFGTFKKFDVDIEQENSSIATSPSLGQKSTTKITKLEVGSSSSFPVILTVTTDPPASIGNTRYVRFFFSTSSNVSNESYDSVLETTTSMNNPNNLNLTQEAIDALGFAKGSTVYARVYGESFWSNNYDDPDLKRTIFPNLNSTSAPAVSFVVN
jgi:hypothetical protein